MTSGQEESFWALIITVCVLLALVLVGGPSLARLLFRSKLEGIRDDGVDAVLDGRLRQEAPISAFLGVVDDMARHARWVTLARGVALVNGLRDLGVDDPGEIASKPRYDDLPCGERTIVRDLEIRVQAALRSYLIWGSPAGWAIAPLVVLASHIRPGGKFARTEESLPVVAHEALHGDPAREWKTTRWALR